MQHIQGISRNQLHLSSLEDKITSDNPVRFIDTFVQYIDLQKVGFTPVILKSEGRPSFKAQVFLKTYSYSHLNYLITCGTLAIAKTQVPVKAKFMSKGIYA